MEMYKLKWMLLGALVCIKRILKKKVNDNIVLDVFTICQKLQHVQVIYKIPYSYILCASV